MGLANPAVGVDVYLPEIALADAARHWAGADRHQSLRRLMVTLTRSAYRRGMSGRPGEVDHHVGPAAAVLVATGIYQVPAIPGPGLCRQQMRQ